MLRPLACRLVLAQCALIASACAAAAQSTTTRIEPRPFYGAVVTLEEGVRVIRPLPAESHVIINPNNTPLSLSYNNTRVYESSSVHHTYDGGPNEVVRGGVAYGFVGNGFHHDKGRRGFGSKKRHSKVGGVP